MRNHDSNAIKYHCGCHIFKQYGDVNEVFCVLKYTTSPSSFMQIRSTAEESTLTRMFIKKHI